MKQKTKTNEHLQITTLEPICKSLQPSPSMNRAGSFQDKSQRENIRVDYNFIWGRNFWYLYLLWTSISVTMLNFNSSHLIVKNYLLHFCALQCVIYSLFSSLIKIEDVKWHLHSMLVEGHYLSGIIVLVYQIKSH